MRISHWLGIGLMVGCAAQTGAAAYEPVSAPAVERPVGIVRFHDSAFATLGLPPLATHALSGGVRELRFSLGHGWIAGPEYVLIRIVEDSAVVRGEIVRARLRIGGGGVVQGADRWRARRVPPAKSVNWERLLARADSLRIGELEPPRYNEFISDTGDLLVEVRRAGQYRAYWFNAPDHRSDSVGRRAAAIASIVDSLDRLTRGY